MCERAVSSVGRAFDLHSKCHRSESCTAHIRFLLVFIHKNALREQGFSRYTKEAMAKRILLVEDEKALATVLNLKLKNAGYETSVAYDGDEALEALKAGQYDLMLIDIMMPKRDGFSVLEELKKQNNQTPVFAMSNLGQDEDIARIKNMGVKDYIIKADASPGDILERVSKFLGQ